MVPKVSPFPPFWPLNFHITNVVLTSFFTEACWLDDMKDNNITCFFTNAWTCTSGITRQIIITAASVPSYIHQKDVIILSNHISLCQDLHLKAGMLISWMWTLAWISIKHLIIAIGTDSLVAIGKFSSQTGNFETKGQKFEKWWSFKDDLCCFIE